MEKSKTDKYIDSIIYWFKYYSYIFMLLSVILYLFYMYFDEFVSQNTLITLKEFIPAMNIFMFAFYLFLILALHDETKKIMLLTPARDLFMNLNDNYKRYTTYLKTIRMTYIIYFPYMAYFFIMF